MTRPDAYRAATALLAAVALALSAGCLEVPQDPNDPENPVTNPIDANGPGFVQPVAHITSGPPDGSTIATDRVTYEWAPNTAGVADYIWQFDADTGITTARTLTIEAIEEGAHAFSVVARYSTGARTPADSLAKHRRTFAVRAFTAPAVYLYPRQMTISRGESFSIELKAAKLAGADAAGVKGLHAAFLLPAGVTFASHDVLGFLGQGSAQVFGWAGMRNDSLVVDLVRGGASAADSGGVVRLNLIANSSVATDSIRLVRCDVRNGLNRPITGVARRGARLPVR